MGSDNRIGKRFLFPGIGYGGSCFPKDVQALVQTAAQYQYDYRILHSVIDVNDRQKLVLADKIIHYFGSDLRGLKIAIWGLAFKPNTDDIREAPALYIIESLVKAGAELYCYDPEAMPNVEEYVHSHLKNYQQQIHFTEDAYAATKNADALAICTEWSIFRTPDWDTLRQHMKGNTIFDGRNLFDLEEMKGMGFYYNSMGRKTITS
ncbi:MAG TPA: UDP binding domain-containing protein, partial [Chitinophagaceae bacterium]|nr:UDP binding domain-containing protein [Chitinophagaceae bacterium]